MLLTVLCAVPILVVLLMLVCDDRINKRFLNNPTDTGLKPAQGLYPWMVLWITYSSFTPFSFSVL